MLAIDKESAMTEFSKQELQIIKVMVEGFNQQLVVQRSAMPVYLALCQKLDALLKALEQPDQSDNGVEPAQDKE